MSKSGYYACRDRSESNRSRKNWRLTRLIEQIFHDSRGIYGSPRVHQVLQKGGESCSLNTVAKIMQHNGLKARISRVYWRNPRNHAFFKKTDNLRLERPAASGVNQVWVGDVTYIKLRKRWQYLAAVMDLYSRRVVGWAVGSRRTVDLTQRALMHAIKKREPPDGLIFHSDRGIEYASYRYQDTLKRHGIEPSMNRPGHCQDNAHMESFFHSLKGELIRDRLIRNTSELKNSVKGYIIHFYNKKRLHSSLGYTSPVEYERLAT